MRMVNWLMVLTLGVCTSAWAEPLIVKIGSAAPKTGAIAHLGIDNENGVRLAIEDINAKGDLLIGGQKVVLQLVGEDDQGQPILGPVIAQKLVDEGVVAVVGHLNSGISIPANTVYAAHNLVQISPASTNPDYTYRSHRTKDGRVSAYRVIAEDGAQPLALFFYLKDELKAKRILLIDDATDYGQLMSNNFLSAAKNSGLTIYTEHASDELKDFKDLLALYKSKNIDAILWTGMDEAGSYLAKDMKAMGIKSALVSIDGTCTDLFIDKAKKSAEGMVCSMTGEPIKAMAQGQWFEQHYYQRFQPNRAQLYSPYAYDAVYALVHAMKIANSTRASDILDAMPKVNFRGVTGNISFDAKGDLRQGAVALMRVRNQKLSYFNTYILEDE